jgi:GT2 family glycosyltransferase
VNTSIAIVAFNHRPFLEPCLDALDRSGLDPRTTRLILIDNASTDGTAAFVVSELLSGPLARTRGGLPVVFIASDANLGFSGGNNLAFSRAIQDGDQFVYLLNPDTEVEPGFLAAAIAAAELDPRIAIVQSLVLRHGQPGIVNSYGDALHFLGFGYSNGDGRSLAEPDVAARISGVSDLAYACGTAALVRTAALEEVGCFQEELFAYCEDVELCWRARLAGYRVVLAPASRVQHKYDFYRSTAKFYLLERNRWLVLLWCYRARTLALLAPALLAMELGVWAMAVKDGWWREKGRACRYLLTRSHWSRLAATRRAVQKLRRRRDREITELFAGVINFGPVSPWLLTRVANPALSAYWRVARKLLAW